MTAFKNLMECSGPAVSVITVVFNAESLISRTIESVLDQTYSNLEYIIVDGNSNDDTSRIISLYTSHAILHHRGSDRGIYDAMNKGVLLANGKWIIFMNAGDIFADNEVLSNIFSLPVTENVKFLYSDFIMSGKLKDDYKLYTADYKRGIILHQSVIYQKELHRSYGQYLVTPKIIISDYLFFNAIPEEMIAKTEVVISINNDAGISQGSWCYFQKKCADYIFRRITLTALLKSILLYRFKKIVLAIPGIGGRTGYGLNKNIKTISISEPESQEEKPDR